MEERSNSKLTGAMREQRNRPLNAPHRRMHQLAVDLVALVTIGTSATTGYLVAGYIGAVAGAVMGACIGRFGGNAVVELVEHDRQSGVAVRSGLMQHRTQMNPRHHDVS